LKLALGVYWDRKYYPYCPSCKKPLSNYAFYQTYGNHRSPGFKCINCKEIVRMSNGADMFLSIEQAKAVVENILIKDD
jgi:hypothetical protein